MITTSSRTLAVLLCVIIASASFGQDTPKAESPVATSQPAVDSSQIAVRKEQVSKALAEATAALEALKSEEQEAPDHLKKEIELLNRLDLTLGQIIASIEHTSELEKSLTMAQSDLKTLRSRGPAESRPFPFSLLETLRDELATEKNRIASRNDAVEVAQVGLKSAKDVYEEKERNRRRVKEELEKNEADEKAGQLNNELKLAKLESEIAEAVVHLRKIEHSNQKLESDIHEQHLTFVKEKAEVVENEVQFRKEGLDEFLARLDELEYRVNQALDWAKVDLNVRDSDWMEARRRLDAAPSKEPALVEEVEARRLARQVRQREITLLGQQLQAIAEARKVWNRRFQIFNNLADEKQINEWQAESKETVEQINRDIRLHKTRLEEIRRDGANLDSKAAAAKDDAGLSRWLSEQNRQNSRLTELYTDTVGRLEATRRLHQKLNSEIGEQTKVVTWDERFAAFWAVVVDIWNYELTSIQDNPITVRKVVVGILLLVFGIILARKITRLLARRFFPRLGLNEGAAAAVQSMLFYLLVLTVAMLSLRIVNVPLTAFTILGGALAIGVGFGSQNVMNNFISGLIMLAERPIRVGDLIQIEDLVGTVEHIGPRSTRVRSPQNMDIIVPNSSFLEKNVVNWTLSDDRFRAHVSVGVEYGSPTRDVSKLIYKALSEHGKVLSKPEPIILFSDFGDSALIFEAHFWIIMRRLMDRRVIESDIRYRIDSLFREGGITIAFPQTDIHIDNKSPIQVSIRPESPSETDESD